MGTAGPRLAALVVAALMLGGCAPGDEELRQLRLEEAVAVTLDGRVAFNLSVDAPDGSLDAFGEAAGPLAALLDGSSAAGVIEEDRVALGLAIGGIDVLQARVTAPGEQYLRFNLGAVAELATGEPGAVGSQLEQALVGVDLEPAARAAVLAAGRGEWVRLAPNRFPARDGPDVGTSLGDALAALLLAAVPVGHEGDLGAEPFDGRLDIEVDVDRALAAAAGVLAGLAPGGEVAVPSAAPDGAEVLPGRVLVEAGIVRAVVLQLGPLAGGDGGVGEAVGPELVLDLRRLEPGDALVRAPEVAATVTPEQLRRAAAAIALRS